jgi:hypothetical protein
MADTEARLQELQDGWQTLTTDEQERAIGELDTLRAGLDLDADGPLIDRIERLRADLTLTVGLQPATEEQGFKG